MFRVGLSLYFVAVKRLCLLLMKYQQTSMTFGFCYSLPAIIKSNVQWCFRLFDVLNLANEIY